MKGGHHRADAKIVASAKNPQRDLPIGIIASLVICTVLYLAVGAVLSTRKSTVADVKLFPARSIVVTRSSQRPSSAAR